MRSTEERKVRQNPNKKKKNYYYYEKHHPLYEKDSDDPDTEEEKETKYVRPKDKKFPNCWFDISVDKKYIGRLEFELFDDLPRTA